MNINNIKRELNDIASLIEKKNADYGDAFAEASGMFRDYPQSKIYEKTKRIIQLSSQDNAVPGEGLRDALRDCIGYCALYLDLLTKVSDPSDEHERFDRFVGRQLNESTKPPIKKYTPSEF